MITMGTRGDRSGEGTGQDEHDREDGEIGIDPASEKESSIGDDSVRVLGPSRSEERSIQPE